MNKHKFDDDEAYNPTGFVAFTEEYLLSRGYCCGNGCKNCPFDYKNVVEPRRTELLNKRIETNYKP
jgi:Family of unknown function (DUF5522)